MTNMENKMKLLITAGALSLLAISASAGVMLENSPKPKVSKVYVIKKMPNYKTGYKDQTLEQAQQGELYRRANTNVYAKRTSKNPVAR
jgi:hypothetical protein